MKHTLRLKFTKQGAIVYSKIQVVTQHYQRFSCSQYLLLVQSSSTGNQESDATLTLKKRNTMPVLTHRFALIFQSTSDLAYSRSKSASKSSFYSPLWIAWKPDFLCT
ncbi:hypothetical protein H5410_027697 [Solanum commersonii]|uniref:Uncharacterized protein n=1 Tax=Solanum commersonii TaxID=4109 RepID=A0A9J5Z1Z1_SOLCO|nr:hypothetical protein H5410_027697 [Solanum commersonii]